jgi:hypothetical protein
MTTSAGRRAVVAVLVLAAPVLAAPVLAQPLTVEALLARVAADPYPQPYTLTADFTATVVLFLSTGRVTVRAQGAYLETRAANGAPRARRATVQQLDVPWLLRPFTPAIRKAVVDLIETEQRLGDFLPTQDIFVLEERAGRYVLGGVRRDIVTETMQRYGQGAEVNDPTVRRALARWLHSPARRATIVRSGPPYALTATVDEAGLVHQLVLYYDWGQVGSRFVFVLVNGRPFWREVQSESSTDVQGLGRVDGHLVLVLSRHCLNCTPR